MKSKEIRKYFWLLLLPTALAFLVVFFLPFVFGIGLSFTRFTTVSDAVFVGMDNYREAFATGDFWNALWFTVRFAAVSVISVNVFAFLLALALTRGIRGTNFFRTVFFLPNLIGGIVLGYIWQLILNGVLARYGYSLTSNATYGFWGLVILMNWQMIGYMMIVYIAGIQNVPPEQLEAARVDGAGPLTVLRKIVLPSVMPSITICLFLTLTNSFKLFDQNLALTAGAPGEKTQMLALNIYETFYARTGAEGVGQAKAVVFFLMVAAVSFLQLKWTGRKEQEAA